MVLSPRFHTVKNITHFVSNRFTEIVGVAILVCEELALNARANGRECVLIVSKDLSTPSWKILDTASCIN